LLDLVALPSRLVVRLFQVPLTPSPAPPTPPHCCFVALLLIVVPYCSTLLVGTPSSLSCASGRAWSNTNKLVNAFARKPIYL